MTNIMENLKTKKYGDLYNHLCSAQYIADEIGDDLADEILRIREKIGKKLLDEYGIKHDLEKELKLLDNTLFDLDGVAVQGATHYLTVEDVKDIAKRFYELGLNAQKGE